jgi:predicted nucleic acid-binding protein
MPTPRAMGAEAMAAGQLAAPGLLAFGCSNIIRRHELAGLASADQAAQAHADLLGLPVQHWPHELLALRVEELRSDMSSSDASSVAVAELINAPMVT